MGVAWWLVHRAAYFLGSSHVIVNKFCNFALQFKIKNIRIMSVMSAHTPFLVFSGTNSRYLAEKICNSLGCPLGRMNIQHFADGEFSVSYEESIRGRDVFLVQSTFPNSDNLMELLLMIDAAKRASAHSIIAVIPYFGWARQDRKDKPRVSIGAKLIADMLSTAFTRRLSSWSISRTHCPWITCASRRPT